MDILNSIKKIKQNRVQEISNPATYPSSNPLSKSKANNERQYYKENKQDPVQRQNLQTPFVIKAPQPSSSQSVIIHDVQIHKPPQDNDIQAVTEEKD
ncbi:unnamed protein product [Parnassius apollo]|uniref:(apollo) hypothetical protein n=1 Tax=Parnassius apollo TaxID=110799 RepID=A0A8S3WDY8_PARAO|nr:unnamed protein product [Parnassius apollo]